MRPSVARRAAARGQATVEAVALWTVVALLVLAVGAGVAHDVAEAVTRATAALLDDERATTAREAAEDAARRAVDGEPGAMTLLGARRRLAESLGDAGAASSLAGLVEARIGRERPRWDDEWDVPIGTIVGRGWARAWWERRRPRGPATVHLVTPADEDARRPEGRSGDLRSWLRDQIAGAVVHRIDERLAAAAAARDPALGRLVGLVGPAAVALEVVRIHRAEADERWPGPGEQAGDAIVCRPILVGRHWADEPVRSERPGVRIVVLHEGRIAIDAVSTRADRCLT